MPSRPSTLLLLALACRVDRDPAPADDTDRSTEPFPRCADHDPRRRPFFGDTHVHTALSLDAATQGTRLRPADAYRFARGEAVGLQPYDANGSALRSVRLGRPLDFVVVSDHAEFLGTVALCTTPGSPAYDAPECVTFREQPDNAYLGLNALTALQPFDVTYPALCGDGGGGCLEAGLDVWSEVIDAAEAAYDRTDACTFTSFVGYEWSGGPATLNLHRNVVFRNEVVPSLPASYFDEPFVDGLYARLREDCAPPCDVLAIPHNSNLSSGLMFEGLDGGALTEETARARAAMEPLVEVFQHKGDSECWPGSPTADELCGFEKLPFNSLSGARLQLRADPVPLDFVRDALAEGLRFQDALGVNPYRFGLIASTDTHVAVPGLVEEDAFPGHGGAGQGHRDALPEGPVDFPTFSPGGLAVLWAEENSREALFRAMRRREAYATSGPRIVLRFYGGFGYDDSVCEDADLPARGDAGGVPMGGELPAGSGLPRFVLAAQADAGTAAYPGVPLQRLQIVKGWREGDEVRVRVFDVAGDATAGRVDLATCAPDGAGDSDLCTVWTDPAFDPAVPAFWYARAIEAPSCRWTAHQCLDAGVSCPAEDPVWSACCDQGLPKTVQERAWSSPIWHTP